MKPGINHRGEILYQAVQESGVKLSKILELTGYHRSTYYTHVNNPDLAFEILYKYGKAIPRDFSLQFPEIREYFSRSEEPDHSFVGEAEVPAYQKMSREALLSYTTSLREKYLILLEENRALRLKIEALAEAGDRNEG